MRDREDYKSRELSLRIEVSLIPKILLQLNFLKMNKRIEVVRSISDQVSVSHSDDGDPFHIVPKLWLKSWVTGIRLEGDSPMDLHEDGENTQYSVIDLTDAVEHRKLPSFHIPGRLFDDPPSYDSFICRHRNGICPSRLKDFKVISDVVYAIIMSTVNPEKQSTTAFTTASALCESCVAEYDEHSSKSATTLDRLLEVIKLVGQGTERNEYDTFVLSKTWLSQLRKTADSFQKEAERTVKSVEAFFKGNPKPLLERIDPTVNSNLCCVHGKLRKGFKRSSFLVSRAAWSAILSLCKDAISFAGGEEDCTECVILESVEEYRKEELQEVRGAQLEDPALYELVRLLKRRPYYPVEFDKPEFLREYSPKRYCLIESKWLRAWHSYILDISAPEPGSRINLTLSFPLTTSRPIAQP